MFEVVCGDCIGVLKNIQDFSVDLVVTSPPYAEQRKGSYGGVSPKDYPEWIFEVACEIKRVLKDTGSFVLNIKEHVNGGVRDRYVMESILKISNELRWIDTYIWVKKNPFPTGSKRRLKDAFEYCYHFSKTKDYKFFPENVLVPSDNKFAKSEARRRNKGEHNTTNGSGMNMSRRVQPKEFVRSSNVVTLPVDSTNHNHPATFPVALPERFIKLMTENGDVVLDPFSGSGTTGVAAVGLGRSYIGIDLNEEYCAQSRDRILKAMS